jgi:cytochrome P450 family 6/cytochrome P450 family 28
MVQAVELREKTKITRDDYLAHLINLKNKKELSELDMAAHGVTFFIDGFETSANAICHVFYEVSLFCEIYLY